MGTHYRDRSRLQFGGCGLLDNIANLMITSAVVFVGVVAVVLLLVVAVAAVEAMLG